MAGVYSFTIPEAVLKECRVDVGSRGVDAGSI